MIPNQLALFGIFAAVLFNIVLSVIWYSPKFLGKVWLKSFNFQSAVLRKPTMNQYIGTVIISIVVAVVLWLILDRLNVRLAFDAAKLGFLFWLGFIATTDFTSVIWEKKPVYGYLIDVGYWLISLLVISPIIAHWH